ncbi:MAG: YicC family protein [Muribaculaceae bacterium]|nr:YicC family protein [Muribaculaceae bacterium]
MLMSMTGFGKASAESPTKKISVEVKSLNSKQLDLNVRIPYTFREHELEVRSAVGRTLERGKIDVLISAETAAGAAATLATSLNVEAMAEYKRRICEASAALGIPEPADWYGVLLRFPDVLRTDTADIADADDARALADATEAAIEALMAHRRAEGLALERFFAERIEAIGALLAQVEPYEKERVAKIRLRLEDGLAKIPVVEYDKGRLEQEMIFYIEKLDVNEEKQRLAKHLAYFMETMALPKPGQGKKLGFIAQEMGREINTLGSKSNHAGMQAIVVKMKDLLEQIKEQVLNVM